MKLRRARDVLSLPKGQLFLEKDGAAVDLAEIEEYAYEAAEAVIEECGMREFSTRSEVIRYAMEELGWGLVRHGYIVKRSGYSDKGAS